MKSKEQGEAPLVGISLLKAAAAESNTRHRRVPLQQRALTMAWNALHPVARNLLKLDTQGAEQGEALVSGHWRE